MLTKWDGKSEQEWEMEVEGHEIILSILSDATFARLGLARYKEEIGPFTEGGQLVVLPLSWFSMFNREVMRFIFWHEVGHIVNRHKEYPRVERRDLWREFEADAFAVSHMGVKVGIEALKASFMDSLNSGHLMAAYEFKIRIELLQTYCNK